MTDKPEDEQSDDELRPFSPEERARMRRALKGLEHAEFGFVVVKYVFMGAGFLASMMVALKTVFGDYITKHWH